MHWYWGLEAVGGAQTSSPVVAVVQGVTQVERAVMCSHGSQPHLPLWRGYAEEQHLFSQVACHHSQLYLIKLPSKATFSSPGTVPVTQLWAVCLKRGQRGAQKKWGNNFYSDTTRQRVFQNDSEATYQIGAVVTALVGWNLAAQAFHSVCNNRGPFPPAVTQSRHWNHTNYSGFQAQVAVLYCPINCEDKYKLARADVTTQDYFLYETAKDVVGSEWFS